MGEGRAIRFVTLLRDRRDMASSGCWFRFLTDLEKFRVKFRVLNSERDRERRARNVKTKEPHRERYKEKRAESVTWFVTSS